MVYGQEMFCVVLRLLLVNFCLYGVVTANVQKAGMDEQVGRSVPTLSFLVHFSLTYTIFPDSIPEMVT